MCCFLTISFKKDFAEIVKSEFSNQPVRLRCNENSFFKQNFGDESISLDITDGHCSCSIYPLLTAVEECDDTEKMIAKYRSSGWSESKIQRAVDDRRKAKINQNDELNLREILVGLYRRIGFFWLFAHQYKGSIENEPLKITNRKELRISELSDKNIEVPEDVIVKIKK
jgi:hypothetical protein